MSSPLLIVGVMNRSTLEFKNQTSTATWYNWTLITEPTTSTPGFEHDWTKAIMVAFLIKSRSI